MQDSPMNPQGFAELVRVALMSRHLHTVVEQGRYLGIAPKTLGLILKGEFPGVISPSTDRRLMLGRLGTLIRVCARLDLDADACLRACGLHEDGHLVKRVQDVDVVGADIQPEDIQRLLRVVDALGSLSFDLTVKHLRQILHRRLRGDKDMESDDKHTPRTTST